MVNSNSLELSQQKRKTLLIQIVSNQPRISNSILRVEQILCIVVFLLYNFIIFFIWCLICSDLQLFQKKKKNGCWTQEVLTVRCLRFAYIVLKHQGFSTLILITRFQHARFRMYSNYNFFVNGIMEFFFRLITAF